MLAPMPLRGAAIAIDPSSKSVPHRRDFLEMGGQTIEKGQRGRLRKSVGKAKPAQKTRMLKVYVEQKLSYYILYIYIN